MKGYITPLPLRKMSLEQIEYLAKLSHRKARKIRKIRRQWWKHYGKIRKDMLFAYPDQVKYEILNTIRDPDVAYRGDFDDIRPELAQLIDKLLQMKALPNEVDELLLAIQYANTKPRI